MAFVSQYQTMDDDDDDGNEINEFVMKEGDDLFIDLVGERPWLYNKTDKGYSDQIMTYNAWKDISIIMNDSIENCKQRWKKIYNHYLREKLLQDKETRSGSAASKRHQWPLFERMQHILQKNTNQFHSSYTNAPSVSGKTQIPQKCYTPNRKNKKPESNEQGMIQSLFNKCNATISTINKQMNEGGQQDKSLDDPNELYGMLIEVELNRMDYKVAKTKRKALMKYLSDLDSD